MDEGLKVDFLNCGEIRMGSRFAECDIRVTGKWRPALPAGGWAKVLGGSPDRRYLGLARWNTSDNEPGFHVYTIDTVLKKIEVSEREFGLCERLVWTGKGFHAVLG